MSNKCVSIIPDSSSSKNSSASICAEETLKPIVDLVHPVNDVIGDPLRDPNAVQETLTALRRDYGRVFAALKKHQNTALQALTWKLRFGENEAESRTLKALEVLRNERESLLATIEGLNQTLLDQRIRVAELREANKRYRRERVQLRNDLYAHMAEVNYLTRMSSASSSAGGGDPLVVRKIAKLEESNRELLARCHKFRLKLAAISNRGKTVGRKSTTRPRLKIKLTSLPQIASVPKKDAESSTTRFSNLTSSNCRVLVSIKPAEMDYRQADGGSGICYKPRLVLSRELIDAIRDWNRVFLTSASSNGHLGNLTWGEILRLEFREEIKRVASVRQNLIATDPVLIGRFEFEVRVDLRLTNDSNRGLTKEGKSIVYTTEESFTQTSSKQGCRVIDGEETRNQRRKLSFLKKLTNANVSCLKNGRTTRLSSPSSYRSYSDNNNNNNNNNNNCCPRRSVRFDPEVRCFCIDDIDAKISCAKRAKFIQGARDLFHTHTITLRSNDVDEEIIKNDDTVNVKPATISSSNLFPVNQQSYSLVGTVYNYFL